MILIPLMLSCDPKEFHDEPHLIHRDDTGAFRTPGEEEWMAFFSDPSGNILALAIGERDWLRHSNKADLAHHRWFA